MREAVASQEASLLAAYDATMAAYPDLVAVLTQIRAEHLDHAESMGVSLGSGTTASAVAPTRAAALTALVDAEQQAIALRTAACEESMATDLARITALIAASEAGHAEYLRGIA